MNKEKNKKQNDKEVWELIIKKVKENELNLKTIHQNGTEHLNYKVNCENDVLKVSNSTIQPSVNLNKVRIITKDDFLKVLSYYPSWKEGTSNIRPKIRACSQNSSYILGIISYFDKNIGSF